MKRIFRTPVRLFRAVDAARQRTTAAALRLLRRAARATGEGLRVAAGWLSPRTWTALIGLALIGTGLSEVSTAAALAVPGSLLFLLAVPAASLITRRGGSS